MLRRLVIVCATALALIAGQLPVHAQSLDAAVAKFTTDEFSDTADGIAAVVASGAVHSLAILEALQNRRLFFAGAAVLYKDAADKAFDARTGIAASIPADAQPVRLNNRLRGALEAALGSMTLRAADPSKRIAAAEAVFKSRDEKAMAPLEAAASREKEPRVAKAFAEARAAILVAKGSAPTPDIIAAVATLKGRGDQDAMSVLRGAASSATIPEVKQAAQYAVAEVERKLRLIGVVQDIYYGLSLGSVLLLAAAGLAITFGVMGVINMAHGEMVMIGAYTTFVMQELVKAVAPGAVDYALLISIPAAFIVAGAIGIAIERGIIRFLYGRPLETLLATWGVSLILQQAIRTWFGASNVQVSTPTYMRGSFEAFGLQITYGRLWIIIVTLIAFALLLLFMRRSTLGLQMRAVTQNRRMASAMGIRTGRVDALTFGLGCGIAGIAGVALSQIDNVAPNLGQNYIVDCFMVVVFGGVGSLWGTLVSAFSLGIANKLLEPVAGAVLAKIFILLLLILFIQKRPRGLFALKGRAVEA
jgi:urea transport system permease protein